MARVEIRPSGGHQYVVVVDDVWDDVAGWRKRVIRSFGNVNNLNATRDAHAFAAAVNAGKSFLEAEYEVSKEDLLNALKILAGAALAAAAIAWLFGEK